MKFIYYYDICAIFILAILLGSLLMKKTAERLRNNLLIALLTVGLVSAVADLIVAIVQNSGYLSSKDIKVVFISTSVYFFCHNLIIPMFLMYVYASLDIWHLIKRYHARRLIWGSGILLFVVLLIVNWYTGIIFNISSNATYVRGEYLWICYFLVFSYAAWGFGIIIRFRKIVDRRKMIIFLITVPIVGFAVSIQLISVVYLLENFALALIALIYIIVIHQSENPIDPASGSMKYTRALERVKNAYIVGKPFTVTLIKLINSNSIKLYLGDEHFREYLNVQSEKIAETLKKLRYSGDSYYLDNSEFAIFGDDDNKSKAMEFAYEMEAYYRKSQEIDNLEIFPEAAICVVGCPSDVADVESLINLSITFSHSLSVRRGVVDYGKYSSDRKFNIGNAIGSILAEAISNNDFKVDYQPIYSNKEKCFVGAEAVIGIKSKDYGYVDMETFLPVAENSGLIADIGKFVVTEVVKFIKNNDMEKLRLRYIQLPLFVSSHLSDDIAIKIKRELDENGIKPEYLCMKVTQMAVDNNPANAEENITNLYNLGISFALDKYGSGYSNIRSVVELPFKQIRLDESFVSNIKNPSIWQILKDSVTMFKGMERTVLINRIEDKETAEMFIDIGVDLIQGCDLSKNFEYIEPMTEDIFVEYLKAKSEK